MDEHVHPDQGEDIIHALEKKCREWKANLSLNILGRLPYAHLAVLVPVLIQNNPEFAGIVEGFLWKQSYAVVRDDGILYALDFGSGNTLSEIKNPFLTNTGFFTDIVETCAGLICFYRLDDQCLYLCNPFRDEFVRDIHPIVSNPPVDQCVGRGAYTFPFLRMGFGYSRTQRQFKVVMLTGRRRSSSKAGSSGWTSILTVGFQNWRRQSLPKKFFKQLKRTFHRFGVYLNGNIHWLISEPPLTILAFDLDQERFGNIPAPPIRDDILCSDSIEIMGNYLSVVTFETENLGDVSIWRMSIYGKAQSWVRALQIHFPIDVDILSDESRIIIGGSFPGKLILEMGEQFFLYDTESQEWSNITEIAGGLTEVGSFHPSLLSSLNQLIRSNTHDLAVELPMGVEGIEFEVEDNEDSSEEDEDEEEEEEEGEGEGDNEDGEEEEEEEGEGEDGEDDDEDED